MPVEELIRLIIDNGTTVFILAYFIYRDYKFMDKLDNTLEVIKDILNKKEDD